ncbi:MAG: PAS domain S-box protein [Halarcobacter sp.]
MNNLNYLKNINILYAEDDLFIQKEFSSFLKSFINDLYIAEDGLEALELFEKHSPDIVISDITMPKMNGIELSREIKSINPDVPIIIISAHNNSDFLIEAIEIGVSRFILKPIDMSEVMKILLEFSKNIVISRENKNINNILEQYKEVVDLSSIVSKADKLGFITYVNQPFIEISGYTREELIGSNHNIIRHPDTPVETFEKMWNTIKEEKKVWKGIVKNKSKNGKSYYVSSTIKPILDIDGNIIEYIAMRHDITALENTKHFLQRQNFQKISNLNDALKSIEQYENVMNAINIVSRINTNGKITYVNEQFLKLTGYSKDELIGQTYDLIRHEDNDKNTSKEMWKIINSGKLWTGIIKNKSKDGKTYHINAVISPIFNQDNEIIEYISICHDISPIIELHQELESTQREIIYRMGEIGETRSKETGNHVKRVAEYSKLLGELYKLDKKQLENLFMASPMHDIGKVGIPDEILNKPGKLTSEEWLIMKTHSELGYKILKDSNRDILKAAAIISYHHHEKWDGSGYPRGLKEDSIHIFGRITAIADVFDALGSDRCYKKAWPLDKILQFFKDQKGKHFDPELVDLFMNNLDSFLEIRNKYID